MDPLDTETARFWENHGDYNDVDPATIQTEVIQLPTTCFAEEEGSLTNSGRWLQWHWPGRQRRRAKPGTTTGSWRRFYLRLRALYARRAALSRIRSSTSPGPMTDPHDPTPAELAKEYNGQALDDLDDPTDPTKVIVEAGKQLPNFAHCATMARRLAAAGSIPAASTRRATTWPGATTRDPDGTGTYAELDVVPGRSTAASSTTAPPRSCKASPGIRAAS